MIKLKSEEIFCISCMEKHNIDIIKMTDIEIYKGEEVSFDAIYEYCKNTDEYSETEVMIRANSLAMKDAYRKKVGLLTSKEIISIRKKYHMSQKDFSRLIQLLLQHFIKLVNLIIIIPTAWPETETYQIEKSLCHDLKIRTFHNP